MARQPEEEEEEEECSPRQPEFAQATDEEGLQNRYISEAEVGEAAAAASRGQPRVRCPRLWSWDDLKVPNQN